MSTSTEDYKSGSLKAFMQKPGFPQIYKIVCCMLSRPESEIFREPVDWKGLGLTDYPDLIKKPMDLGTIKKKIEDNRYDTIEDITADIRLVWWNCMHYNRDGSEVCNVLKCSAHLSSARADLIAAFFK